jgi:hypothetical protein
MRDRGLSIAGVVLRFGNALNYLFGAGFVVAIALSFVFGDMLARHLLAKYPGHDIAATIAVMRVMAALGIVAVVAIRHIFRRLLAILATVRAGDPFVAHNADRLHQIGWALLVIQLLDLATGVIVVLLDRLGVDHATWTPGFAGWIAVVMTFVLARVFRVGAAMRDDLAMTI